MRKFWSLFQTQNFSFLHLPLPLHYLTQILSQPSGVSRTVGLRVADPSLQGPEALGWNWSCGPLLGGSSSVPVKEGLMSRMEEV